MVKTNYGFEKHPREIEEKVLRKKTISPLKIKR